MGTNAFIFDIRREIARLEALIEGAQGAQRRVEILRGAADMLEDIEKAPLFDAEQDTPERPGTAREAPSDDQEAQPAAHPLQPPEAAPELPAPVQGLIASMAEDRENAVVKVLGRIQPNEPETILFALAHELEPVTQRQLDVYNALWKHAIGGAGNATIKMLTADVGFHSGDAIEALSKKGYAKRNSNAYPHAYYPIATGQPRIAVVPFPQRPIGGDAARGELQHDPAPGRSALDKKRAIDQLNPVGYLEGRGHTCKRIAADMYTLDRNTVSLSTILAQINTYRAKDNLPPLDLTCFLP
jgi:hypothetical protein